MVNMIYFIVFPMVGDPDTLSSTHKGRIEHSFRMFSYRDMEHATRNFSCHMLLGRGHYGEVYRLIEVGLIRRPFPLQRLIMD
ncbi:putative protein kinase-like domain superfamily [Helianthus anomalus]